MSSHGTSAASFIATTPFPFVELMDHPHEGLPDELIEFVGIQAIHEGKIQADPQPLDPGRHGQVLPWAVMYRYDQLKTVRIVAVTIIRSKSQSGRAAALK